jgi:hypothetical protein
MTWGPRIVLILYCLLIVLLLPLGALAFCPTGRFTGSYRLWLALDWTIQKDFVPERICHARSTHHRITALGRYCPGWHRTRGNTETVGISWR